MFHNPQIKNVLDDVYLSFTNVFSNPQNPNANKGPQKIEYFAQNRSRSRSRSRNRANYHRDRKCRDTIDRDFKIRHKNSGL